jgi:hypothetical protein
VRSRCTSSPPTRAARKHGALSTVEGMASISWRERADGGRAPVLELQWVEWTPPRAPARTVQQRGFGRELIDRPLPYRAEGKPLSATNWPPP